MAVRNSAGGTALLSTLAVDARGYLVAGATFGIDFTLAVDLIVPSTAWQATAVYSAELTMSVNALSGKQYFNPFRDFAFGAGVPMGFSDAGGQYSLEIVLDDTSDGFGDRMLQALSVTESGSITWDLPGEQAESEILTLFKTVSTEDAENYGSAMIRRGTT